MVVAILILNTGMAATEASNRPVSQDRLYERIDSLFASSEHDIPSLITTADNIIEGYSDKITRTAAAGYIFNKFSSSGIMGHEAVAIHIAKKYFLSGKLEWNGDGGTALLRTYTEFNENSLIGMKAPELQLRKLNGSTVSLHSLNSRYTILYFFDHKCSACKETLPRLREIVKKFSPLSVDVYAVFTQHDTASLRKFIRENFSEDETQRWCFVYDKSGTSDYHKLYNVLSTPRLFLLNRDKTIIGRSLDNNSLTSLLKQEQDNISRSYDLAQSFIEQYLSLFNLEDTTELERALTPLSERLINENKDMYNAVFYNLFHYFATQREQHLKEAAIQTAIKYILPHKEIWHDTLFIRKVIPATVEKIKKNRPGSPFPSVTFFNKRGRIRRLEKINARYTYIYFFDTECSLCTPFTEELKSIHKDLKKKGVKIIAIYTGSDKEKLRNYIRQESPPWRILYAGDNGERVLYNNYEIPYIPQTYLLDSEKRIITKEVNTIQIKKYIR
jgi:peroxiredoxin